MTRLEMPEERNGLCVTIAKTRKEMEGNKDRMGKKRCTYSETGRRMKEMNGLTWDEQVKRLNINRVREMCEKQRGYEAKQHSLTRFC